MNKTSINLILAFLLFTLAANAQERYSLNNFSDGWLSPWEHNHFSEDNVPYIHLFNLEPAFLDRDIFLDYKINNLKDEKEIELEFEAEWAITNRIGLILEAPYIFLDEEGAQNEDGLGDFALGSRFLLLRDSDSILSFNLGFSFPSGKNSQGLSEDEYALNYSLSYWASIYENLALNLQLGAEHGLETENISLNYNAALAYSIMTFASSSKEHVGHGHEGTHFYPGMINLILEYSGTSNWEEGNSSSELLFGVSYLLTSSWEVRTAYSIPLQRSNELQDSIIMSLVYHF